MLQSYFTDARNSMIDANAHNQGFTFAFKLWSFRILLIASAIQVCFWPSTENFFAVGVALIAWKVTDFYILKQQTVQQYPLSTLLILGYSLTQFYFPVLFTLLEGKPVVFNLTLPYEVFIHSLLALAVVLFSHYVYRLSNSKKYNNNKLQTVLQRIGLYKPPTSLQIWMMGCVGLLAMMYTAVSKEAGQAYSGSSNKFIEGFLPFTYAPFYLLLKPLFTDDKSKQKGTVFLITIYTLFLFVVSIMINSRGAFIFGFTGVAFSYFLGLLVNIFPPNVFTKKNIGLGLLSIWLLTGPLTDLATAMLITRGQKQDLSATELLAETWTTYQDKSALKAHILETTATDLKDFDETYLDNLFLARFCSLKYTDLSLELSERLNGIDPQITKYAIERPVVSIFPQPILDFFDVQLDKETLISYSYGDFMIDRTGGENELGGFMIGHFAGVGMSSFGWYYLLLLFLLMLPAFYLWDSLVIRQNIDLTNSKLQFSLVGLLFILRSFQFISFENVLNIGEFLIRNWLQLIVLYLLLFKTTSVLSPDTWKK